MVLDAETVQVDYCYIYRMLPSLHPYQHMFCRYSSYPFESRAQQQQVVLSSTPLRCLVVYNCNQCYIESNPFRVQSGYSRSHRGMLIIFLSSMYSSNVRSSNCDRLPIVHISTVLLICEWRPVLPMYLPRYWMLQHCVSKLNRIQGRTVRTVWHIA